jgi:TRAP-type C4-dicarboxylate transport system substrate-binding protein
VEQSEFIKKFGGVPVTIGTAEVATSLQRGVVSVVLTAASGGGRLWIDLLDHTSDLGPNFNLSYILVSKAKFDSLSAQEQEALRKIAGEEGDEMTRKLFEENETLLKDFAANKGLTVTPANADEEKKLTEAMAPYWDEWAKDRGELAVKVLADVKAKLGK